VILDANAYERPNIEYPCEWGYKIIGTDKNKLEAVVFEVMESRDYTISKSNRSSKGKFHALTITCRVTSEKDRDDIFRAFQEHQEVKMVI